MYRRILVAVDGSENGERAAAKAGRLAAACGAEVLLVTVEPRTPVPDELREFARSEHLDESPTQLWEEIGREVLQRAVDAVRGAGGADVVVSSQTRIGEPANTLLAAAGETEADAIVVGTRGFGRVKGLLLGSVSQKLVAAARVDVLVVR
jgi:nucleotide-binding universal stress UspA family protein